MNEPQQFINQLVNEIAALKRKANRKGLIPVIRLNGTSDIDWMEIKTINGYNIFDWFAEIQFYDYTKVFDRLEKSKNYPNYHLTFSRSEENLHDAWDAMAAGFNVTMVCSKEYKTKNLGDHIDGDTHDLRFLDKSNSIGYIVFLTAKGKARKDKSGFVVR